MGGKDTCLSGGHTMGLRICDLVVSFTSYLLVSHCDGFELLGKAYDLVVGYHAAYLALPSSSTIQLRL